MEPQQSDAHAEEAVDMDVRSSKTDNAEPHQQGADGVEFDADLFASLLKNQLIAYNFSWDPLMKALETLAASMARQQRTQKGNNDSMDEMREQLEAMRDRLDKSDQQKEELATSVSQLQDQVGTLSTELEAATHDQNAQRDELQTLRDAYNASSQTPLPAHESPRPTFASTEDLQNVKRSLSDQLRKSLSAVFGQEFVVNIGDEDDEESMSTNNSSVASTNNSVAGSDGASDTAGAESAVGAVGAVDAVAGGDGSEDEAPTLARPPSRPGTGVSGVLRTPLPGVPFASEAMVNAELEKLRSLQAALEATLAAHKEGMATMDEKLGTMDAKLDAAATLQQRRASAATAAPTGPSTDALQRQLDELKEQQQVLLQQLKDQAQTVDKQASGFKELVATLDDMAVQQKLYSARSGNAEANGTNAGGAGDAAGPAQLDLSLVFSKIADLRRATDASLDQIQQNVREATDSTSTQQTQLDALRHAAVFNELQKLRLMEARLALQKELLDRNQTHQDRTKPQLAEWKKQLEQTEEKLVQGLCDQDIMDEMQQLQRNYHRTMLTVTPLINSPLMIAESLQKLADEVKDVQSGMQSGVLAGVLGGPSGDDKHQRVDEFSTKLRYLDEEIEATQQVNVVTEKKNDPLLKSLDTMRDKLESMWSLWHQNLIKKKRADGTTSETSTPRPTEHNTTASTGSTVSSDALRDLELRLMGSVRRINTLEEEVDRLGALVSASAINGSHPAGATTRANVNANTNGDDVAKLRKEIMDEVHRLSTALANLQSQNQSALVPSAPPGRLANHASSPNRGDMVGDLHAQMVKRGGKDIDGRFHDDGDDSGASNGQRTTSYDALLKDLTKKVTQAVMQHVEKTGGLRGAGGPAGIGANPNVNFRALLENFTQKFDDRLEDTREFTIDELAKLRKELLDLLKAKLEAALRDLRAEFMMLYYPSAGSGDAASGDSTAVGTKPVMCVACSRPVPVSGMIREPGTYPSAEMIAEQTNALLHAELEYDRNDEDFVYRGGFKMPADRKTMTLPFLATNIRNRIALNKIDRKPRRPARQQPHGNPVDHVVREAMELDRKQRHVHGHPPSPPK